MPSTYELLVDSSRILGSIEAEQGVLTPECELALAAWLESSEDKLHNCLALSRRLDSEATLLKAKDAAGLGFWPRTLDLGAVRR